MCKDIVISALAAVLAVEYVPWSGAETTMEKIGIFVGFFVPLLFFCFFCEEMAEKWRKYRKRVRAIRSEVTRLRYERREIEGNFKQAGAEPGHAFDDAAGSGSRRGN